MRYDQRWWSVVRIVLALCVLVFAVWGYSTQTQKPEGTINTFTVTGADLREEVECEFDAPMKYINLIMHYYDTREELYADYILRADPADKEEIWGWSDCIWQPDDSWAACDVYVVTPDFVHADMNIDTLGHEVFHGVCGGYHD